VYMLKRSLGASSFAGFWRAWNPLFSYYLSRWCYRPLARRLPRPVAVVSTFAVSGAIHDLAASLALLRVFLFFTPVFAALGVWVVLEEALDLNVAWAPVWLRALIHTGIIAGTLATGRLARAMWF